MSDEIAAADVRRAREELEKAEARRVRELRDHLIANAMHDDWETIDELVCHMREVCGIDAHVLAVVAWLEKIGASDLYALIGRVRAGTAVKEFRIVMRITTNDTK